MNDAWLPATPTQNENRDSPVKEEFAFVVRGAVRRTPAHLTDRTCISPNRGWNPCLSAYTRGMDIPATRASFSTNQHRVYDALAPVYRELHERFLRMSGGEAQSALIGALTPMLVPGLRVLDAGCGDGALSQHLLSVEPNLDLAMVDASARMLALCEEIPARRIHGSVGSLPFRDESFDVVVAAWLIETTAEPRRAIRELVRCVKPRGWVFLTFCADRDDVDAIDMLVALALKWRGTGRLLDPACVEEWLNEAGATTIRRIPCRGPTVAIVAGKDCIS